MCYVNITSTVSYNVSLDSNVVNSSSYTVQTSSSPELKPFTVAFVSDSVSDPNLFQETYGLAPGGWTAGPSSNVNLTLLAFDPQGISTLNAYSSTTGGAWSPLKTEEDPIQSILNDSIVALADDVINPINNLCQEILGYNCLPTLMLPVMVSDATISSPGLGNYEMFMANATASDGSTASSPEGFYYVVNTASTDRLLIIDPHVELWLLLQNLNMYLSQLNSSVTDQFPSSLVGNTTLLSNVSQLLDSFEAGQFHYWNLLGENYNISISFPDSNVGNLLQSIQNGGFQPDAIYLSDLSLGLQSESGLPSQFFDWDLSQIYDSRGNTILSDIINYTKTNHAALIGSAGVLSDWQVWDSCSSSGAIQIGSRGNIGEDLSDGNPGNEQTLAPMFGMPLLPVFENIRDQLALDVCEAFPPAGDALGSIPLLVPIAPWNGTLEGASSFNSSILLNPNEAIMNGTLNISMPNVYSQFGYDAINTIGWQLSLPNLLAYDAWNAANQSRSQAQLIEQKMTSLAQNLTGVGLGNWTDVNYTLSQGLHDAYSSIVSASINSTYITVTMNVPTVGNQTFSIPFDESQLASLIPAQIAALSPDYSAGIVTYDKYYDPDGYRSVYFSFPIESSNQSSTMFSLISNAITWAQNWSYISPFQLGNVFVSSETDQTFNDLESRGTLVSSSSLLANEDGASTLSFDAQSQGIYEIIVAHPTSLNVTVRANATFNYESNSNNVSLIQLDVTSPGNIGINITADPESSFSPSYIAIIQSSSTTTTTTTTSTTQTSSTSSSSTTTTTTTTATTSTTKSSATTSQSSSTTTSSSSSTHSSIATIPAIDLYAAIAAIVIVAAGLSLLVSRRRR